MDYLLRFLCFSSPSLVFTCICKGKKVVLLEKDLSFRGRRKWKKCCIIDRRATTLFIFQSPGRGCAWKLVFELQMSVMKRIPNTLIIRTGQCSGMVQLKQIKVNSLCLFFFFFCIFSPLIQARHGLPTLHAKYVCMRDVCVVCCSKVAEMKGLSLSFGVIRNEGVRWTVNARYFEDNARGARLRRFGCVQRREDNMGRSHLQTGGAEDEWRRWLGIGGLQLQDWDLGQKKSPPALLPFSHRAPPTWTLTTPPVLHAV